MTPQSMQPQAPKRPARTIVKEKPTRRLQPGDLICRECGEGNPPVRKFCSRCGTSLAEAEIVKKKWWQKLFPKRNKKVLEAGQRPGREGVKKKKKVAWQPIMKYGRMIIGGLILFGSLLYTFYSPWRSFVNEKYTSAKDWVNDLIFQQAEPVRPTGDNQFTVSSQIPQTDENPDDEFPAQGLVENAFDLRTTTHWISGLPSTDPQPTITVNFGRPVDIDRILIHNGAGDPDLFQTFNRASVLHVIFGTDSADIELEDSADEQTRDLEIRGVESISIQVRGVFDAPGDASTAIAEIEFFRLD
jgi:hypothetical protein